MSGGLVKTLVLRLAVSLAVAAVAANAPVAAALHANSIWFFVASFILGVGCTFAVNRKRIPVNAGRDVHIAALALMGLAVQMRTEYGISSAPSYAVRVGMIAFSLFLWLSVAPLILPLLAPESDAERARP